MANSNRFKPVVAGKKECSKCGEIKDLEKNYYFHSATGYYYGKCKACVQKEKRLKRPIASGRREDSIYIRQKICTACGVSKDLNLENFSRSGGNFTKICKCCNEVAKKQKAKKRRKIGYLPDTDLRKCIKCEEEKFISEFSFSAKNGYYSSYCKSCDVKRKQEKNLVSSEEKGEILRAKARDWHKNNREKSALGQYRKFDFNRSLTNDLTEDYLKEELSKPCIYCSYSSTGLDRIDNTLGHTIANCVPCCGDCNVARNNNFSHEEMLLLGKTIKGIKDKRINEEENP